MIKEPKFKLVQVNLNFKDFRIFRFMILYITSHSKFGEKKLFLLLKSFFLT